MLQPFRDDCDVFLLGVLRLPLSPSETIQEDLDDAAAELKQAQSRADEKTSLVLKEFDAKLEAKIMLEAREETARILAAGKERSAAEIGELRRELEGQKSELAAQIAARIIDRGVTS